MAIAVYVVYLAPVLATGEPTFTGYVKLDDTATWMAMTDRVLSFGHDLSGLAPSTYETTLHFYLTGGEPVGAMLPWGIGHQLVGEDLAWVVPAVSGDARRDAGAVDLGARRPAGPLAPAARRGRVHRRAVGADLRLLAVGRDQGGRGRVGAGLQRRLRDPRDRGARADPVVHPAGRGDFAMLGVFGFGGAVWLASTLVVVGLVAVRIWLRRYGRLQLVGLAVLIGALAVGLIRGAQNFVNTQSALTSVQLGNLVAPLRGIQLLGIWPAGDFRVNPPNAPTLTHLLIWLVIVSAIVGVVAAVRRRAWALLLYPAAALVGVALTYWKGSPWVLGKALATASPALLLVGLVGMAILIDAPRGWISWENRPGRVAGGGRRGRDPRGSRDLRRRALVKRARLPPRHARAVRSDVRTGADRLSGSPATVRR